MLFQSKFRSNHKTCRITPPSSINKKAFRLQLSRMGLSPKVKIYIRHRWLLNIIKWWALRRCKVLIVNEVVQSSSSHRPKLRLRLEERTKLLITYILLMATLITFTWCTSSPWVHPSRRLSLEQDKLSLGNSRKRVCILNQGRFSNLHNINHNLN